jgi:hypothetical protein
MRLSSAAFAEGGMLPPRFTAMATGFRRSRRSSCRALALFHPGAYAVTPTCDRVSEEEPKMIRKLKSGK